MTGSGFDQDEGAVVEILFPGDAIPPVGSLMDLSYSGSFEKVVQGSFAFVRGGCSGMTAEVVIFIDKNHDGRCEWPVDEVYFVGVHGATAITPHASECSGPSPTWDPNGTTFSWGHASITCDWSPPDGALPPVFCAPDFTPPGTGGTVNAGGGASGAGSGGAAP